MPKTFNEYLDYLGGVRLGNYDNIEPIASLGDNPPKGTAGKDQRGVGLHASANFTTQAPGTLKPMVTAQDEDPTDKDSKRIQSKNKKSKETVKEETLNENLSQSDLDNVEKYADRLFLKVGLDVEFSKHFKDRVNDARNGKPITSAELTRLFKQSFNKHKMEIKSLPKGVQAVLNDTKTDINMPFVITLDRKGHLEMMAKTIMRKKNFATSNKKITVEDWSQKYKDSIDCDNPKGFSQKAHCQGKKKRQEEELEESMGDDVLKWFKHLLPKKLYHSLNRMNHAERYHTAIKYYHDMTRELRRDKGAFMRKYGMTKSKGIIVGNIDGWIRDMAAGIAGLKTKEFNKILDRRTRYEEFEGTPLHDYLTERGLSNK